MLGEVRQWSTSCSWPTRRSTRPAGRRRSARRRRDRGDPRRRRRGLRRRAAGRRRCTRRPRRGEAAGRKLGEGPGADPRGGHRADASARRCSSRWRSSAATRCSAGLARPRRVRRRLVADAPRALQAGAQDRLSPGRRAVVVYFGVTLVQVWLTSRDYAPADAEADRGDGRGAVRRRAVPGPAGPARRGAPALQAAAAPTSSSSPAARRRATSSPRPRRVPATSRQHGVPHRPSARGGGDDS